MQSWLVALRLLAELLVFDQEFRDQSMQARVLDLQFGKTGVVVGRVGLTVHRERSGKEAASLPLPPLRTGLDGFHHPAQAVCKLCRGQNR
jgi:hypothetical protein